MSSWRKLLPKFIVNQWENWFKKMEGALVYFTPAYVSRSNTLFSPLVALIALIAAVVMVGLAIGSFVTLFACLLVLYFILTKIFGIQLDAGDVFVV